MIYEAIIIAADPRKRFYKETRKYKLLIDIHEYKTHRISIKLINTCWY